MLACCFSLLHCFSFIVIVVIIINVINFFHCTYSVFCVLSVLAFALLVGPSRSMLLTLVTRAIPLSSSVLSLILSQPYNHSRHPVGFFFLIYLPHSSHITLFQSDNHPHHPRQSSSTRR